MAGRLICASCGYEPDWDVKDWGRHPETHGLGPTMVCPKLVDDHRFPPINGEQPQQTCGGVLVPKAVAAAARARGGA